MAIALEEDYKVSVITSAYDLHSSIPYEGIALNNWNKVHIPGSRDEIDVYYDNKGLFKSSYQNLFKETNPSVVYFNNIYSSRFFRVPLQVLQSALQTPTVVICPRGMLQKGALAVKPLKKKIYLNYLRYKGLLNTASWHATNHEEANDIQKHFPKNKGITIAPNIPKRPYTNITFPQKQPGQLKLVYLSLIAEKKNLLGLLQVIKATEYVVLDIYGPVTDNGYWQQCEALIKQMPEKVHYKGDVQPAEVQHTLSKYHALILLTKGENFGHALYESLSVGRPVITSYFTPWIQLEQKKAGANVDISDVSDCLQKLSFFSSMNQEEHNIHCQEAHQLALQYYNSLDTKASYKTLFDADRPQEGQKTRLAY